MKIAVVTNAGGGQLDVCLSQPGFRDRIDAVISDSQNRALDIADRHGKQCIIAAGQTKAEFNAALSDQVQKHGFDALLSVGFTRLFSADFLNGFSGHVFNSHFSLLPAFPGKRGADWTTNVLPPRAIFERALLYGARFIGNTVHVVDASIDGGRPVMQSCLPVPYDIDRDELRHELFLQECRCLFQFIIWLAENRVAVTSERVVIAGAKFDDGQYSPALEEEWIKQFAFPRGIG